MYPIEKRFLVKEGPRVLSPRFIIAHESGNPNNTGPRSLDNEVSYMISNYPKSGVFVSHWVGGGGRIIQLAPAGIQQAGVGPVANPYAYAQVELARTADKETFAKDYRAYVWLLAKLAKEAGIPTSLNQGANLQSPGIKTHHWVSTNLGGTDHVDPDGYLASWGISLDQFARDLAGGRQEEDDSPVFTCPCGRGFQTYQVVKGDTLCAIGQKLGLTVQEVMKTNGLTSSLIYPGQILYFESK